MTFRRENDPLFTWRRKNAPRLIQLGIPEIIVSDHHRFLLAVQNGEDFESGWTAYWIDQVSGPSLLALLLEQFDPLGCDLVDKLQRIHGPPALELYDVVRLRGKRGRFNEGSVGTIVHENAPDAFIVEFSEENAHEDSGLLDVQGSWCELVSRLRE
ncbi:hypothetical protein [Roseovarius atlanticus]|uniref:hypothetical protein n=1 Tax=Roseovarius atlanticus TaxID=1641875 RepID=UPI000AE04C26|nr:hypothetical protein [Roseovarius atlanticus]